MKLLQLESCISATSFVPWRTLGSALTSLTAASMATLATLPMVELWEKRAPMCTVGGLIAETFLPRSLRRRLKQSAKNRSKTCFMVGSIIKDPRLFVDFRIAS